MESSVVEELFILGAGGHAITVAEVAIANNPNINITFIGESSQNTIFNFPVVSEIKNPMSKNFIVGVGDNSLRKRLYENSIAAGMLPVSIVSKQAYIGLESRIGEGSFIGNGCITGAMSKIGRNCILNTNSQISHEAILGDCSQMGPSSAVGGKSKISQNVFIGIGGIVIDRIKICDDVTIGANSTVINDIDRPGTYVGSPVRKVK